MANYNSEFTGPQVDEAIQQVLDNHEDWSNKADPEDVAVVAGAVAALQTAMNGKADLQAIAGAYRLRFSQVPMCFLSSVTAKSSYAGSDNNQIWYCTDGKLYYHANDTDYELGSPQYILYYCGNAIYKWGGSNSNQGFIKIVDLTDYFEDGRLKMSALPENLPTGGLSDDIYTAIKDNVDTLWSRLNDLIGDLANLAFRGTRTPQLTNNDKTPWPENEGSDQTPTLTKPANNGGTILVGTASGGLISTSVEIKGIYLTQPLAVSVSGAGFGISSLTPSPISAASANAGTTITVTYNSVSLNSATGSLLISSSEISRTANLLVLAGGGTTQTFVVTQNLTGCSSSYLGGTVTEGTTLTIVLTPDSGWTFDGGTISATMNNVAVSVTNGQNDTKVISFGAVSGDIVITAEAVAEQPTSDTVNVTYKLLNMSQPSGTTQDQVWGYYKEAVDKSAEFNKELTVIQGAASNNDLTVKSGGVVKYKYGGSNNATGYAFSDGTLTITAAALALLTDDLIIEATACTGTVTVKASESGVTATIGGTTITCSTSNGDETYSGSASGITSINSMSFSDKTKIVSIDFGGAKFTGSTLASAFSGCTALTQFKGLVVTGSVTSLASMFENCSSLISLEAIGWNMPSLTSLYAFLYKASKITKFDASTWYAPNVANLHGMFASCNKLEEIDISGISTKNVNENAPNTIDIAHMFHLSPGNSNFSLTKLTIGEFDTSNVTNIETFFWLTTSASVELHCKSRTVPSISSTPSLIWFGNQNQSNNNKKYMISSVYVPTGCRDAYYDEWGEYIGLTKEDFYEE